VTRDTLNGYPGCARYDNEWSPYRIDFLPHRDDEAAIDAENQIGCAAQIEQSAALDRKDNEQSAIEAIFDVFSSMEVYAPTDPSRLYETMIRLEVDVSMIVDDDGTSFDHSLSYVASPAYPEVLKLPTKK
jgi:hypothetical protein